MANSMKVIHYCRLLAASILLAAIPSLQAETSKPERSALITGLPSAIAMRSNWAGAEYRSVCLVFTVRLLGSPPAAVLAANGFDGADVAPAPSGTCPEQGWGRELRLRPGGGAQHVALRIAPSTGPAERTGDVIVYSSAALLGSAPVKVQRSDLLPLWTEFKWAIGFIVPAMVAFLFGLWTAARAERQRARAALVVFRTNKKQDVEKLVGEIRTALTKGIDRPGLQILQSLQGVGAIGQLPLADQERVVRYCEQDRLWRLLRRLRRLFPLQAEKIKAAAADRKLPYWRFL